MKKQLLLFIMPLLLIACGKSNEKPNNSSKWGDLRKIEGIITPVRSGKLADQDKFTWSKKEFNAEGELILLSTRDGVDVLEESKSYDAITTYKYNKGKLIEKSDLRYRYTYTYVGKDTSEIKLFRSLALMETWKREYGSNGKLSKESGYYSDGTLYMMRLFAYDTNGHNSSIEILEKPFTTGNQLLYTYNSRGDVLTETYFDRLRDRIFSVNEYGYTYDSNNRLIEFIKNTSFDKVEYTKWVNTYDEEGRIIKQDMYRSNKFDGPYEQVAVINFTYTYSR